MQIRCVIPFAIVEQDVAELCVTNAQGVCKHRLKHRLHITRRRADNFQYFRGRGLLLKRLGQIVGTLA